MVEAPLWSKERVPRGSMTVGTPPESVDVHLLRHTCSVLIMCLGGEFLAASAVLDFDDVCLPFPSADSNLRLFVSRDGTTTLSGIQLGNR